jgi:hypothetical protein
MTPSNLLGALLFFALGGAARHFSWSTETRWHILAFGCAAAAFEIELRRPVFKVWPTWSGFLINAIAATIATVAVKTSIEGLPGLR